MSEPKGADEDDCQVVAIISGTKPGQRPNQKQRLLKAAEQIRRRSLIRLLPPSNTRHQRLSHAKKQSPLLMSAAQKRAILSQTTGESPAHKRQRLSQGKKGSPGNTAGNSSVRGAMVVTPTLGPGQENRNRRPSKGQRKALKRLKTRWAPPLITPSPPVRRNVRQGFNFHQNLRRFVTDRDGLNEQRDGKYRNRPLLAVVPPTVNAHDNRGVLRNPQFLGKYNNQQSYNTVPPPASLVSAAATTAQSLEPSNNLITLPSDPAPNNGASQIVRKPRPIIIDGSNVAIGHSANQKFFSCRGLELCINRLKSHEHLRHGEIICFVPAFRKKKSQSVDTEILERLEETGIVKFTPSRDVNGRHITPYDDRFILEYATEMGGIVITNDNYKDLYETEPMFRDTITYRLLPFTWANDFLMFPSDPLGKYGPNLAEFCTFPIEKAVEPVVVS